MSMAKPDTVCNDQLYCQLYSEPIGQGGFSTVFLAYATEETRCMCAKTGCRCIEDGQLLAFKIYNEEVHAYHHFCKESEIFKSLEHHENVVSYMGSLVTVPQRAGCIVMEYVHGVDLYDLANDHLGVDEHYAYFMFRQMVKALIHCHSKNIVHRDLKLENFIIDQHTLQVKLIDFGFAAVQDGSTIYNEKGTPGTVMYGAPELYHNSPYDAYKTDCYALGMCLFILVHGIYPFTQSKLTKYVYGQRKELPLLFSETCSDEFKDLVIRMMDLNPGKRMNCDSIKSHSWMVQNGLEDPSLDEIKELVRHTQEGQMCTE